MKDRECGLTKLQLRGLSSLGVLSMGILFTMRAIKYVLLAT